MRRLALGVTQVTLVVMSTCCPPAVAVAVKQSAVGATELSAISNEVNPDGPSIMLVTLPKVTVAVVVALAVPDAAVMVLVPAETPVRSPPVEIVATLGVSLDQHTVVPVQLVPPLKVSGSPWLSSPAAVNCRVSPMLTVGFAGSIVILETVGFTKNPLQLTASARTASAPKAPARRNMFFVDDIVI